MFYRLKKFRDCSGKMYLFGNGYVLLLFLPINSLILWCKSGSEHSLLHMANLFLAVMNYSIRFQGFILGLLRYLPLLYTYHNPNCTKKNFLRTSKRLLKQNIKIIFVILCKIFKIVMGKYVKMHLNVLKYQNAGLLPWQPSGRLNF